MQEPPLDAMDPFADMPDLVLSSDDEGDDHMPPLVAADQYDTDDLIPLSQLATMALNLPSPPPLQDPMQFEHEWS